MWTIHEAADEFQRRDDWLTAWNRPRNGWAQRTAGDIAYTMEALGAGPDLFAQVLALTGQMSPTYVPAGLNAQGYRFGVARPDRTGGELLGVYGGVAIVAWTVSVRPKAWVADP